MGANSDEGAMSLVFFHSFFSKLEYSVSSQLSTQNAECSVLLTNCYKAYREKCVTDQRVFKGTRARDSYSTGFCQKCFHNMGKRIKNYTL